MFTISLVLVLLISTAILLYQYWSGALTEQAPPAKNADLPPAERVEPALPARAA
jgi:hypothetical protein